MRILIGAAGRLKPGPLFDLQQDYLRRFTWPVVVREVEERRKLPPARLKAEEAGLLLGLVPQGATVVALDERGRGATSPQLAQRIGEWRDGGISDLVFLIGGADGHEDTVRARADWLLAFGAMTWPHLMVRTMLLEQLYRAQQILAGHPYHRV